MRFARFLFLLCLLTFLCTGVRAQCPVDLNVTLSSQTEVDIYALSYPECNILANLTINGSSINDISGLNRIRVINGNLTITGTQLTNLNALWFISRIGEDLSITDNALLSNCSIDEVCDIVRFTPDQANINNNAGDCVDLPTLIDECTPDCHPDFEALIDFYNAMDGPNWANNSGWAAGAAGTNCDVSSWFGVTTTNGRVTLISFPNNNGLSGPLPAELGDLSQLLLLNVTGNVNITGQVPPELFSGTPIANITLSNTAITSLPTNIGDAANLRTIRLENCDNFSGPIPESISALNLLSQLVITDADITAPLPAGIAQPFLQSLSIQNTTLPGPLPDLSATTSITFYSVNNNPQLGGPLPDLTNNLDLSTFRATQNNHTGTVPTVAAGEFSNLLSFNVSGNQLSGNAPVFPSSTVLREYDLSLNNFSGTIDGPLFPFSNDFSRFILQGNNFSGPLPSFIGNYNPTRVFLGNNNFGGCYPESWANLCGSTVVGTGGNDNLPSGGSGSWFQDNVCDQNIFCDDCHPDLTAMVRFYLGANGSSWTNKTGWEDGAIGTDCDVCNWHGVTCDANGRVISLVLVNNGLSGTLPEEVADLPELQHLNLSNNSLAGSVPDLSPLLALQILELANNQLSGSLPSLGNKPDLTTIQLNSNDFTGGIPTDYNGSGLPALERLFLSANQLSGELSTGVASISTLTTFHIFNNDFSGCYPDEFTSLCGSVGILFSGNDGLPDGGSTTYFNSTFCPNGTNPCGTVCPPEDLLITNQQDMTDFRAQYPNCTDLTHGLLLEGTNLPATGIDLDGLLSVGGDLEINDAPQLTKLSFLSDLTTVNGSITLNGTGVTKLAGLVSLDLTRGDLNLLDNDQLTDLSGLGGSTSARAAAAITSVENLRIIGNDQLASLETIGDLVINDGLFLLNNSTLAVCEAAPICNKVATGGTISISGNAAGCSSATEVENACSLLPVNWVSFEAVATLKTVKLYWRTTAEEDNEGFVAERSADGNNWLALGEIPATEAPADGTHHYAFTDAAPLPGETFYRLRQVDFDGSFSYSEVRVVNRTGSGAQVYPNPAQESFTIYTAEPQAVNIHAADGRLVRSIVHLGGGAQVQREGLKSGVYWLRFSATGEALKIVIR